MRHNPILALMMLIVGLMFSVTAAAQSKSGSAPSGRAQSVQAADPNSSAGKADGSTSQAQIDFVTMAGDTIKLTAYEQQLRATCGDCFTKYMDKNYCCSGYTCSCIEPESVSERSKNSGGGTNVK